MSKPKAPTWIQLEPFLVARCSLLVYHLFTFSRFTMLSSLDCGFGHLDILALLDSRGGKNHSFAGIKRY
ncbi:MAG: hypothetical protein JRJ77_03350 [Deltaproteobacteria bacterium]|nr:hypothetical protein [Deltaproteobacteria bacterium]